jgi:glycosyltransferase involved in cell wall biosynthesis
MQYVPKGGVSMKVSVVCPTFGREAHGERLYEIFVAQTYENRELLILDDSPWPSPFFKGLKDARVQYHHTTVRTSVGAKRNWLARAAQGEFLAHFDDDDYYAPCYLERMLAMLGDADLIKLSGFYIYSVTHGTFAYWDLNKSADLHFRLESTAPVGLFQTTNMNAGEKELWQLKNLMGYGFSCVYRKSLWHKVPFADARHGEDFQFFEAAMQAGASIKMPLDCEGLAVVLRHSYDNSIVFPQYLLPNHLIEKTFGLGGLSYIEQAIAAPKQKNPP